MSFALDVSKFAEATGLQMTVVVKKFSVEILKNVVMKTPVKTGRARGNWNVAIGSPDTSVSDVTDPSGSKTIAAGTTVINGNNAGSSVFISNNLPYISGLEHGHSIQAPSGMVAVTMASVEAYIKKAVAESKVGR